MQGKDYRADPLSGSALLHRRRTEQAEDTMTLFSAHLRRGFGPWQGLLLTASLLAWSVPTTAQITIEAVPASATEGSQAFLLAHNLPGNLQGYRWYRGETPSEDRRILSYVLATQVSNPGPAYSHRETVYPNGSLLIQNLTKEDTGFYILQTLDLNLESTEASGQLHVYPQLSKPSISINNSSPVEGEDSVALTCEPKTQDTSYLWWIAGQSLPNDSRLELSPDNRTLTLLSVTRKDMGPYECENRNPANGYHSDPVTLNVLYGPDAPIISPQDQYFQSGANLSLSCHTASNPPARFSWLINGSPQQSTQELFIASITTNNSGSYICLVHNSATGRNSSTVKTITVLEPVTQPSVVISNATITEEGSVVLSCTATNTGISILWIFNNQNLQLTKRMTLSADNSTLSIDPVRREDAGEYQCEVSNPASARRSDPVRLSVIIQDSPGLSPGAIAGIVVGAVAGLALVAALAYFLYFRKIGRARGEHDPPEHKPSAGVHCLDLSEDRPKTDEVEYSFMTFNVMQPEQPTSLSPSSTATETIYSTVKK